MKKIFCIGFQKTGTTSLEQALIHLGYRVCGVRYDLIESVSSGEMDRIHEVIAQFDAFQDNPWPVLYKELDKVYPGSKFILTLRDEAGWYKSVLNHFNATPSKMQELIYQYPFPAGHQAEFLKVYRHHNAEVLRYFAHRPGDLLIINLTEQPHWERICSFLDKPIPKIAFPHVNKGAYTRLEKIRKYLWRRIRARWHRWFP